MSEQWMHKYTLEIGQPLSFYSGFGDNFKVPLSVESQGTYDPSTINSYTNNVNNNGVRLTDHNISFKILKAKDGSKESSITLYNISDNTRKYLEQLQGTMPIVVLYAGYQSDVTLPLIFKGEVVSINETKQGTTRVTEMTVKSGAKNMTEAYTVRSYRAGTSVETLIVDAINDMKLPVGTLILPKAGTVEAVLPKSVIVNSPSKDFLRKFASSINYSFWIEDGTANIAPKIPYAIGEPAFVISSDTSMIGSPTLANNNAPMEKQAGTRQDIKVKTTLNGSYTVGAKVLVKSKYHNGVYEIQGLEHSGTYEGNDWYSDLELKPIDNWQVSNV